MTSHTKYESFVTCPYCGYSVSEDMVKEFSKNKVKSFLCKCKICHESIFLIREKNGKIKTEPVRFGCSNVDMYVNIQKGKASGKKARV